MMTIPNTLRDRLDAGQLAIGFGVRQARTADIGRIAAAAGFDWAFIDMEHSTLSIDTAAQLCVACHDAGVTPIVRVPGYEHYLSTRLLDGGAMGIVFPHVDTPELAAKLVDNCKYPPMGHRSVGGPMAQLGLRAHPRGAATELVNRSTVLVMMVETPRAVANADAIAAVPGVDVLLIGTNDLTMELGEVPFTDPRVVAAYETVIAATRKHGKHTGIGGIYDHPTMERYIRMGARFVLGGTDLSFLMAGAQARSTFLRGLTL